MSYYRAIYRLLVATWALNRAGYCSNGEPKGLILLSSLSVTSSHCLPFVSIYRHGYRLLVFLQPVNVVPSPCYDRLSLFTSTYVMLCFMMFCVYTIFDGHQEIPSVFISVCTHVTLPVCVIAMVTVARRLGGGEAGGSRCRELTAWSQLRRLVEERPETRIWRREDACGNYFHRYNVHVNRLMRDEEGRKKEASKVVQTTRQSTTVHPRQSLFLRKMSCLRWDSNNPRHSTL